MLTLRTPRTFTTWLAVAAVLLGALLPTLSHAAARWASPGAWVEVCTSTGMAWFHTQSGELLESVPERSSTLAQADCAWCLAPGGAGALPPSAKVAHPQPRAATPAAALHHTGPVAAPVWPSALTRAPPRLT